MPTVKGSNPYSPPPSTPMEVKEFEDDVDLPDLSKLSKPTIDFERDADQSGAIPASKRAQGRHEFTITRGGITIPLTIKAEDRAKMERKENKLIDLVLCNATSIKFDYSHGFVSYVDKNNQSCLKQMSELTRGSFKAQQCYNSVQQKLAEISGIRLGLTIVHGKRAPDSCFAPLLRRGPILQENLVRGQVESEKFAFERFSNSVAGFADAEKQRAAAQRMMDAFKGLVSFLKIQDVEWLALYMPLAFSLHRILEEEDPKKRVDQAIKAAHRMRESLQAHIDRLRKERGVRTKPPILIQKIRVHLPGTPRRSFFA